jgi:LacI family transcriptional regulator
MNMKKANLTDIANECNVSKTLVSMVLNGHGDAYGIKKETQDRVFDVAERLNYKSKQFTGGIRGGTSHTIGLIVSDIANPFYAKIARGVEDYASKAGYNLIICSSDENPEKETAILRMLKERRVAGLLISTTFSSTRHINSMLRENFPFVLIDRFFPHTETNYVIVNNYQGAYDATEHLIKLGYRRIAHITVTPSHVTSLRYRKNGYYDALKKHKLRLNKRFYVQLPYGELKNNMQREIRTLLASPNNVQAVFLANNDVTVAFLECVNEMRLRIPHELAIVSFDDIELFRVYYPQITAVEQPIDEICRVSVQTLLDEIKTGASKEKVKIKLDAKLIVRESCGCQYRRK